MRDSIKRYLDAAQSLTEIPRDRAEKVARRLAGTGLIDASQIRGVASELVERSRENRRRVTDMVAREIRRQVSRLGLASKDEIDRLKQRVQALEASQRSARSTRAASTGTASGRAATRGPSKTRTATTARRGPKTAAKRPAGRRSTTSAKARRRS
jgi:polyhydroxyalkanoate synthesis regulator phasin